MKCKLFPNQNIEFYDPVRGALACAWCYAVGPSHGHPAIPVTTAVSGREADMDREHRRATSRLDQLTILKNSLREIQSIIAVREEDARRSLTVQSEAAILLFRARVSRAEEEISTAAKEQLEKFAALIVTVEQQEAELRHVENVLTDSVSRFGDLATSSPAAAEAMAALTMSETLLHRTSLYDIPPSLTFHVAVGDVSTAAADAKRTGEGDGSSFADNGGGAGRPQWTASGVLLGKGSSSSPERNGSATPSSGGHHARGADAGGLYDRGVSVSWLYEAPLVCPVELTDPSISHFGGGSTREGGDAKRGRKAGGPEKVRIERCPPPAYFVIAKGGGSGTAATTGTTKQPPSQRREEATSAPHLNSRRSAAPSSEDLDWALHSRRVVRLPKVPIPEGVIAHLGAVTAAMAAPSGTSVENTVSASAPPTSPAGRTMGEPSADRGVAVPYRNPLLDGSSSIGGEGGPTWEVAAGGRGGSATNAVTVYCSVPFVDGSAAVLGQSPLFRRQASPTTEGTTPTAVTRPADFPFLRTVSVPGLVLWFDFGGARRVMLQGYVLMVPLAHGGESSSPLAARCRHAASDTTTTAAARTQPPLPRCWRIIGTNDASVVAASIAVSRAAADGDNMPIDGDELRTAAAPGGGGESSEVGAVRGAAGDTAAPLNAAQNDSASATPPSSRTPPAAAATARGGRAGAVSRPHDLPPAIPHGTLLLDERWEETAAFTPPCEHRRVAAPSLGGVKDDDDDDDDNEELTTAVGGAYFGLPPSQLNGADAFRFVGLQVTGANTGGDGLYQLLLCGVEFYGSVCYL